MKVNVNFKCFSIVVFKLLRIMMKLFLNRIRREHGAIVGRLSQEVVNRQGIVVGHQYICDTMEREGGCLEPGEYHIMVAKCKCFARQMLFLEPIRDDSSSSSSLPLPETCKLCRMERKSHEVRVSGRALCPSLSHDAAGQWSVPASQGRYPYR